MSFLTTLGNDVVKALNPSQPTIPAVGTNNSQVGTPLSPMDAANAAASAGAATQAPATLTLFSSNPDTKNTVVLLGLAAFIWWKFFR